MQSLGEKIRQARREKGLTQEQLAQTLFVSRQTVSNWENGKTEPDYQTLVRLSELLGLEFAQAEELPPAQAETEAPEQEAETETRAQQPEAKKKFGLRPWLMAVAAVLFVLGLILLPSVGHEKGGYTVDWFQQEAANMPDQAYVRIYTKAELPVAIKQQTAESTPVWEYNLFFREENGVGVTIDELTRVRFYKNGKTDIYAQTVDVFGEKNGGKPSYIGGREFRRISYGCTADKQSIGDGWMLRGTDDNGNAVCFKVYIPLQTR